MSRTLSGIGVLFDDGKIFPKSIKLLLLPPLVLRDLLSHSLRILELPRRMFYLGIYRNKIWLLRTNKLNN